MEDARRESVLTVLCLHCVCCTSLSENSAHLPAFKEEEFKAEHLQLAAVVDQLPGAILVTERQRLSRNTPGRLTDGPLGRSLRAWSHCGRFSIGRGRSGRDRINLQRGHTTFSVSR